MKPLASIICTAVCTGLFSTATIADTTIPVNLQTGWNSINTTTLKNDVTHLTSDRMQGRLSLTAGDNDAIHWLTKQFQAMGLKPAVGNSYLQAVKLIQYVPDRKKSYLQLERGNEQATWIKPAVFTEFHRNIQLTGNVIFAGYGITAPDLHYDDYANIDARGKIVMVFEHEPQETNPQSIFNGKANTCHAANRVKALNAQRHGAIAIIVMPEPNRHHPSNQERFTRIGGSVTRKIPLPSQVREDDELQIPVVVISDQVANRIAGTGLSLSSLQSAIDRDLSPHSQLLPTTSITLHDENKSRTFGTTYNVAGLLEGSDEKLKQETIIFSAHHDHDGMSEGKIWHGADDDASGSAGVLAIAKAYLANAAANNGLKPKRSLLFVIFAAEERGLLGAYYMAEHPLRPLATTRAMINFDMIGRNEEKSIQTNDIIDIPADTSNRLNLTGVHYSPDYASTVAQQNQYTGLILDDRFDNEPALNVFFRSDQFPFVLHGIPAFWWFTGFHPDYHQTTDTADKLNYGKMQKILRLAYLTGYVFANEMQTPSFIKNPKPTNGTSS